MALYGSWMDAVITIATDDDLSAAVNLGRDYEYMNIIIPTMTSADISIYVCETAGGTYVHLGDASYVEPAGTGNYATTLDLAGYQFVKVGTSAGQAANETFRVRGWNS